MVETTQQTEIEKGAFKIRYVLLLLALLLFVLALFSHNKADLAVLDGGTTEALRNWIGPIGAQISRAILYIFGLAAYPMIFLLFIVLLRGFLPFPLKRPKGYTLAVMIVCLGITILMAMWPQDFIRHTDRLGIGRGAIPELALSGGVLGSVLAAPETSSLPPGFIRGYIGTIGTAVTAIVFMCAGLFCIFMADWKKLLVHALTNSAEQIAKKTAEKKGDDSDEVVLKEKAEDPIHPPVSASPQTEEIKENPPPTVIKHPGMDNPAEAPPEQQAQATAEITKDADDDYRVAPPKPLPAQMAFTATSPTPTSLKKDVSSIPLRAQADNDEEDGENQAVSEPSDNTSVDTPVIPHANIKNYQPDKVDAASGGTKIKRPPALSNFGDCSDFVLPPVSLLDKQKEGKEEDTAHIEQSKNKLQTTLESFNVDGRISEIVVGPRVTRFEISLENGVKVEKVTNIQGNIAMDLAAESIRILAPIPGKNTVGIEVPNKTSSVVYLRSLMESPTWKETGMTIPIILGRDIAGAVMVADLAKAPHLLIAGSTGSGKSVCMNTLIMSLIFKFTPSQLRLILVDPKVVELEMYKPLPHLITPVVNDPKKVPLALRWGVNEMERRYKVLAKVKAKNLAAFNSRPPTQEPVLDDDGNVIPPKLPLLIIIIDELADIMMTEAKGDVETSICRIAQKGRAAGLHLVIATQTPRKDVITGLIKANLPTKIAFKVGSNMDSRVILDAGGAEKLLGMGDMLFKPPGASGLERIQGSMVSDPEIQKVVDFVSDQIDQQFDTQVLAEDVEVKTGKNKDDYDDDDAPSIDDAVSSEFTNSVAAKYLEPGDGDLIRKALEIVINENKVSTSYLQRRLGIGYNKSAEIIDILEERGIISGPLPGGQKREILVFDELEKSD